MKRLVLFLSLTVMLFSCTKSNDVVPTIERGTPGTPPPPTPNSSGASLTGKSTPLSVTEPGIPSPFNIGIELATVNGIPTYETVVGYTSQWIDTTDLLNVNPIVDETFTFSWTQRFPVPASGHVSFSAYSTFVGYTYDESNPLQVIAWVYRMNFPVSDLGLSRFQLAGAGTLTAAAGVF